MKVHSHSQLNKAPTQPALLFSVYFVLFYSKLYENKEDRDGGWEGAMAERRKKRNCWHVFERCNSLRCSCIGRSGFVSISICIFSLSATSSPTSSIDIEMIMLDWKYWYIRKKVKSFTCSIQVRYTHKQHTIIVYATHTLIYVCNVMCVPHIFQFDFLKSQSIAFERTFLDTLNYFDEFDLEINTACGISSANGWNSVMIHLLRFLFALIFTYFFDYFVCGKTAWMNDWMNECSFASLR